MALRVGCVLMAAGESRRFGGDKLAAELHGRALLERAMDAADPALFADRVAVVSRPETAARAAARGFRLVINDRPADGLSRTVRLGTEALADCDGILYLVADQPQLTAETVARVVARWRLAPDRIAAAAHGQRRGNPCLFPRALFPELRALEGDRGGTAVIRAHAARLLLVETPEAELADVDTPAALSALADAGEA